MKHRQEAEEKIKEDLQTCRDIKYERWKQTKLDMPFISCFLLTAYAGVFEQLWLNLLINLKGVQSRSLFENNVRISIFIH